MSKTNMPLPLAEQAEKQKANARQRRQELMDSWVGVHEKGTLLIPLNKGLFAKVDADKHQWLNQWNWHVSVKGYAVRFQGHKRISMHSLLISCGKEIDHINRDKLDNRVFNLRSANQHQNQGNRWKPKGERSSKFKGVYKRKDGKFVAQCIVNYKKVWLGSFCNEQEAADAYDRFAGSVFGEFALLNH